MEFPQPKCTNCNSFYTLKLDGKHQHGGFARKGGGQRVPLLLKCGHVYCSVCLQGLANLQTDQLPCPECRVPTFFTRGTFLQYQLPISFFILGLAAAPLFGLKCLMTFPFQSQVEDDFEEITDLGDKSFEVEVSSPQLFCQECETNEAEIECNKCDCILCDSCFDKIHFSKVLRSHSKVLLESLTAKMDQKQIDEMTAAVTKANNDMLSLSKMSSDCTNQLKNYEQHTKYSSDVQRLYSAFDNWRNHVLTEFTISVDKEKALLGTRRREIMSAIERKRQLIAKGKKLLKEKTLVDDIEELISLLNETHCFSLPKTKHICMVLNPDYDTLLPQLLQNVYYVSSSDTAPTDIAPSTLVLEEVAFNGLSQEVMDSHNTSLSSLSLENNGKSFDLSENQHETCEQLNTPAEEVLLDTSPAPAKSRNFLSPKDSPKKSTPHSSRSNSPSSLTSSTRISDEEMQEAESVLVVHVDSPGEFYVHYLKDLPQLEKLNEQIKMEASVLAEPEQNMICAIDHNDKWRRGQIDSINRSNVSYAFVHLLDYGSTEIVSLNSIYSISPKLKEIPFFAHKCELAGVQPLSSMGGQVSPRDWSQTAMSYFQAVTLDQKGMKMKIRSRSQNILTVDLYMPQSRGGLSVGGQLIIQGKAEKMTAKKRRQPIKRSFQLPPVGSLAVGSTHQVSMITAATPYNFYVQLVSPDRESQLRQLNIRIQETDVKKHLIQQLPSRGFDNGSLVLAPYQGEYYRASVIGKHKAGYKVIFVDYGNTTTVNKVSLLPLEDEQLLQIPPMAYQCKLIGVTWTDRYSDWPEHVCERFHHETTNLGDSLLMTVADEGNPLSVSLMDPITQINLATLLVEEKLAKYTTCLSLAPPTPVLPTPGHREAAIVSHVQSPNKFHVQLKSGLALLRQMESKIYVPEDPCSFLYRPRPGDYCLALFSADHQYHRGYVEEGINKDKIDIYFLDYGNRVTLSESDVVPLTGNLCLSLPAQALSCSLNGAEGREWKYEACVEFSRLILEKEVIIIVKKVVPSSPTLSVDLLVSLEGQQQPINIISLLAPPTTPAAAHSQEEELYKLATPTISSPGRVDSFPVSLMSTPSSSPSPPKLVPPVKASPTVVARKPHRFSDGASLSATKRRPDVVYQPGVWPLSSFDAVVSAVSDNGVIYGQPLSNSQLLTEIQVMIVEVVSSHSPVKHIDQVYKGLACVAQYQVDQAWYRGVVLDVKRKENMVQVHFVDYGNSDYIPVNGVIPAVAAPNIPMLALQLKRCKKTDKLDLLIDQNVIVQKLNEEMKITLENGEDLDTFLSSGN